MNIQINIKSNVKEGTIKNSLQVIAWSVNGWIKEYNENEYMFNKRFNHTGTMLTRTDMDVSCNGKTMYIKIKEEK